MKNQRELEKVQTKGCIIGLLITSNRAVTEWGDVFGDAVVATAILDRLLHHSHVLTIRGESYRLKEKRRSGLLSSPVPSMPTGGLELGFKAAATLEKTETGNHASKSLINRTGWVTFRVATGLVSDVA